MIYCINPECKQRENPNHIQNCQSCGTNLLINNRYQLIKPLRSLKPQNYTDIFEVADKQSVDGETRKVLKVLKVNSPQFLKMFEREALTLQFLNHPGIPKVEAEDYFTFTPNDSSQELYCLVMEKILGKNLEEWLAENGIISSSLAVNWLRQLVEILNILHKNHFFHRDIKPSNIILKPDGKLVLIDFGTVRDISNTYLAKIAGGENTTTMMSGGYTPPEQIDGKAVPQSDFYALGRTFVYLLTGKSPVELPNNPKTGKLIWRNQSSKISPPLANLIDEMMALFPVNRPQTAQQILKYLNPRGLLIKSMLIILNSPQFKFSSTGLLIALTSIFFLEIWTRGLRAAANDNEAQQALRKGELFQARNSLEKATKLNPNKAKYQNNLGLVCELQKDILCAIPRYKRALKLSGNDADTKATIHYNLGNLYEDIKDFDKALAGYKQAKKYQGDDFHLVVDARSSFARLQIWKKQNYQLAIEEISTALALKFLDEIKVSQCNSKKYIKLCRSKSTLYKNLGWAYLQLGKLQDSKKYLRQAIIFDEEYKRAAPHCLLAKTLQQTNSKDAQSSWQKCRDYDADDLPEVEVWQLDAIQYLNVKESL